MWWRRRRWCQSGSNKCDLLRLSSSCTQTNQIQLCPFEFKMTQQKIVHTVAVCICVCLCVRVCDLRGASAYLLPLNSPWIFLLLFSSSFSSTWMRRNASVIRNFRPREERRAKCVFVCAGNGFSICHSRLAARRKTESAGNHQGENAKTRKSCKKFVYFE